MYGKAAAIIDHERGNRHPIGQMRLDTSFARAVNESAITLPKDIASQNAASQEALADTDALFLNPWQKTLTQRILNKINAGTPGEAFDLLLEKLENQNPESIEPVLKTVFDRLDSETTNTWAAQYFATELGSFLSFDDIDPLSLAAETNDLFSSLADLVSLSLSGGEEENENGLPDGAVNARITQMQNLLREAQESELAQPAYTPPESNLSSPAPRFF